MRRGGAVARPARAAARDAAGAGGRAAHRVRRQPRRPRRVRAGSRSPTSCRRPASSSTADAASASCCRPCSASACRRSRPTRRPSTRWCAGSLIHETLEAFFREQQAAGRPGPGGAVDDRRRRARPGDPRPGGSRWRAGWGLTGLRGVRRRRGADDAGRPHHVPRRRTGSSGAGRGRRRGGFEEPVREEGPRRPALPRVRRPHRPRAAGRAGLGHRLQDRAACREKDDQLGGGRCCSCRSTCSPRAGIPATALYWYISARGGFAQVAYEPTPENLAASRTWSASIRAGVAAGSFPASPGEWNDFYAEFENCGRCDFTRICARSRRRRLRPQGGRPGRRAVGGRPGGGGAGGGAVSADDAARRGDRRAASTRPCSSRRAPGPARRAPSWTAWWRWSPPGRRIERIAAITFTERAAAELRERVRAGLDERHRRPGDRPARCATGASGRATTSTAPSCPRSTRSARRCCGRSAPRRASTRRSRCSTSSPRSGGSRSAGARPSRRVDPAGDDGVAIDRALGLGLRIKDLRRLGEALTERADIAERIAGRRPRRRPPPDWERPRRPLRAELTALAARPRAGRRRAACAHVERAAGAARRASTARTGGSATRLLPRRPGSARGSSGTRAGRATGAGRDAIDGGARRAPGGRATRSSSACWPRARRGARRRCSRGWRGRSWRTPPAGGARARSIFTDLILWTRDLLRDDPSARATRAAALRRAPDRRVPGHRPAAGRHRRGLRRRRRTAALEPGRLFLVGDPKQSIYRFRRADMAVYAAERQRVERGGRGAAGAHREPPLAVGDRRVGQRGLRRRDRRGASDRRSARPTSRSSPERDADARRARRRRGWAAPPT